jgi:hypothetical protein
VFAKKLLIVKSANVVVDDGVFVDGRSWRKWEERGVVIRLFAL